MQQQTETVVWRRFPGALADEIYLQCRPDAGGGAGVAHQTVSMYRSLDTVLRRHGGALAQVAYETVFFRDIRRDFEKFRQARQEAFLTVSSAPASTFIEQPPLDAEADVVASVIAVVPRTPVLQDHALIAPATGRSFVLGGQKYLFSGTIHGNPGNAFDQTYSMFCLADEVLAAEEMNFTDVVRTWIYLREMERDYGEFNRARREFFRQRNVMLLPASTGICGAPFTDKADFTLSFCALKSPHPPRVAAMTTPTLNEACTYGSDFSRGLRVEEANKTTLYISGTASVDEQGRTAHVDEFAPQVERMLLNIETLLSAQGASFRDLLSAVTYLKNPGDATMLRHILHARGLDAVPNALVHAAVCRPDLLCEMEAIAALKKNDE